MYEQMCGYLDTAEWYPGSDALKGGALRVTSLYTAEEAKMSQPC